MTLRVRIVGAGRAGRSFERALGALGWPVELLDRDADQAAAASGADLLLVCVPDGAVTAVAAAVAPGDAVVAHVAGSLTLDVLGGHAERASLHPLVALPDERLGAERLHGAWFAVAGSSPHALERVHAVVDALAGRAVEVPEGRRAEYHAAAVIASNHLVALLGQVERVAARAGVPLEAYLDLIGGTVANVADLGPAAALTGPVARGDWGTVRRHLSALDPEERPAYLTMVGLAARLVERPVPTDLIERTEA